MGAIKHSFVSAKADDPDTTLVNPSNWNADHDLSTLVRTDLPAALDHQGMNPLPVTGNGTSGSTRLWGTMYQGPASDAPGGATFNLGSGNSRAWRIWVPRRTILTGMVWVTSGAASTNAHLGLYADDGSGIPGALIQDMGQVSLAAVGKQVFPNTSPTIEPGYYWAYLNNNSSASLRGLYHATSSSGSAMVPGIMTETGMGSSQSLARREGSVPYTAAVPTTFPAACVYPSSSPTGNTVAVFWQGT